MSSSFLFLLPKQTYSSVSTPSNATFQAPSTTPTWVTLGSNGESIQIQTSGIYKLKLSYQVVTANGNIVCKARYLLNGKILETTESAVTFWPAISPDGQLKGFHVPQVLTFALQLNSGDQLGIQFQGEPLVGTTDSVAVVGGNYSGLLLTLMIPLA